MCGICGVVRRDGAAAPVLERALGMRRLLEHRGPDDRGVVADGGVALAATRLAIRGAADDARQPVTDPDTGVVVVCNGEIDNHRELRAWLRSRGRTTPEGSDVAILPALFAELGPAFVDRLEGPFALAAWDPRDGSLLLARDRAGERPLFFRRTDEEVAFATELSALAVDGGGALEMDPEGIRHYLRFGRFPVPATPLAGVDKVGPGSWLRFTAEGMEQRRYWRWPAGRIPRRAADPDAFDRVFRDAVARQSDCDVRRGVFLSGGVDSSLVAAVARSLHPDEPIPAFTLRFEETSYDEGDAAGAVARHLGLESRVVWVRPDDFPARIRELVRLTGEPLADPAWVPTALLAERAAREVKLVLVGEGADEIFGGYPTYLGAVAARGYGRLPAPVRRGFAAVVRRWPPSDRKVTLSFLLKRFTEGDGMAPLDRHLLWTSTVPPHVLARLGASGPSTAAESGTDGREGAGGVDAELELLDLLQRHDLETYLAEGLLTKADRASMGWALEPRAPFLDRHVLEFAAGLEPAARVRGLRTKAFLKRYALRYLPRSVVHRRKRGLSVPLAGWLRGPLHDWARSHLEGGILEETGVATAPALALLDDHVRRRADHGRALWTLVVLAEWLMWKGEVRNSAPPPVLSEPARPEDGSVRVSDPR